ncbi:PspC domain-containing protein [Weissella confusa]|uniref:PspC domain-containing protein n=1 Tax=Weissella confusa TaxID=1583 RepID=A0A923SNV6_WEICO|nr:PspC domain-containing protein [Weissella confusa]
MAKKQLTKSRDKVMSGVLGGFAEYFSIDATLLRIIFATAAVFFFPAGYIVDSETAKRSCTCFVNA